MRELTRAEFVRAYAARSGLDDRWAYAGFIEVAGSILNALPCDCGGDDCEGWAMVGPEHINLHLELYAPEPIASAMRALLRAKEERE